MHFVDVIVPLHLPQLLTYSVPVSLQESIKIGQRVDVSLGQNKRYAAIVHNIHNNKPDAYDVKPIKGIIDTHPIVTSKQLAFWDWVGNYYLTPLGDIMQVALPAHLKLMNELELIWNDTLDEVPASLSDDAYLIAEALSIKKRLSLKEIRSIASQNPNYAITELLDHQLAFVFDELAEKYTEKQEKIVLLNSKYEEETAFNQLFEQLRRAPVQQKVLLAYFQLKQQEQVVLQKQLTTLAQCTASHINSLVERGVFTISHQNVDRLKSWGSATQFQYTLSAEQQQAKESIQEQWQQLNTVLLQGVTGSGKTLVYVDIIKEELKKGHQVLLLLPEITLTTQIIARLQYYFGEELGVYHSKFSQNERVEIWNKVQRQQYKIIVGARSAIWLPFQQLKTIIIDEEHDSSYKQQDPAPRFQARDAAVVLAKLFDAKILLGSATPSVETLYNVQQKKYGYVPLTTRYNNVQLPKIEIVSSKLIQTALSQYITVPVLEATQKTLEQGKQVIFFQNKRGYAPFILCSVCGWVPHCKYCDVSMTYHKMSDKLHCHYCGNKAPRIAHCLQCGSNRMISKSFGTEKVEEDLERIFPKKNIARMDWDSMKGKDKAQRLLKDFEQGRVDILVGTQMITKGLDFDNIGLVVVLNADSLLSYPDYKTTERAYQLMEQVSGRAGRSDGDGLVMIQSSNVDQPIFGWLKQHSYKQFYLNELMVRQQFNYPPFTKIIKITCKHKDETKVKLAAQDLLQKLKQIPNIQVQGPAAGIIPRIQNLYIEELLIKLPKQANALQHAKFQITNACNETLKLRGNSSIQILLNIDP